MYISSERLLCAGFGIVAMPDSVSCRMVPYASVFSKLPLFRLKKVASIFFAFTFLVLFLKE